jgi:hypothetical protein
MVRVPASTMSDGWCACSYLEIAISFLGRTSLSLLLPSVAVATLSLRFTVLSNRPVSDPLHVTWKPCLTIRNHKESPDTQSFTLARTIFPSHRSASLKTTRPRQLPATTAKQHLPSKRREDATEYSIALTRKRYKKRRKRKEKKERKRQKKK